MLPYPHYKVNGEAFINSNILKRFAIWAFKHQKSMRCVPFGAEIFPCGGMTAGDPVCYLGQVAQEKMEFIILSGMYRNFLDKRMKIRYNGYRIEGVIRRVCVVLFVKTALCPERFFTE